MASWPPALIRDYAPRRGKSQQWRSTGEHKSQKWIREHWQWYWSLIYITNLIRYARHVQKEGSQKPGKQELGKATRYGREPFRNCFRFAWGHNSIQLRGNVSFPRESRGMIYIRDGRQKTCPPPASHKAASPTCCCRHGDVWCCCGRTKLSFFARELGEGLFCMRLHCFFQASQMY